MSNITIEFPHFSPMTRAGSFIGFMSFKIGRDYSYYKLGTHLLKKPKGKVKIRLVYPEFQGPPTRIMQEELDAEVNAYISANYPEALK